MNSLVKHIRKEYLLDELSKFVSFPSGIIQTTHFSDSRQTRLECPMAVSRVVKTNSSGSGADLDAVSAMIKSLAEALERHSLRYAKANKDTVLYKKSIKDLKSMGYLCFCPKYDIHEDFVYRNNSRFKRITADLKTNWVPAKRFSDNQTVWLPEGLIYSSNYKISAHILKALTTNGMSCSFFDSALEEAVLELAERDAFVYMWLSKNPGCEISFDEINYKPLKELIERIDCKRKQIKIAYNYTDTQIPYVFIIFKGEKKYDEPAFFITGNADVHIERGCYRAILGFISLYNVLTGKIAFYENIAKKVKSSEDFKIKNFTERTAYYTMYENFHRCKFLFDVKGPKKLSELSKKWNVDEKKPFLKGLLKDKDIFVVDVTPQEIKKTPLHILKAYSPDLLEIEAGEDLLYNSSFKRKRVEIINKALRRKTSGLNFDPHCYT